MPTAKKTPETDGPVIEIGKPAKTPSKRTASVKKTSPRESSSSSSHRAATADGQLIETEIKTEFPSEIYKPTDSVVVRYVDDSLASKTYMTPVTDGNGDPVSISFSKPGVEFVNAIAWEYFAKSGPGLEAIKKGELRFICKLSKNALRGLDYVQKLDLINDCYLVQFMKSWAEEDPVILDAVNARLEAIQAAAETKVMVIPK